MTNIKYIENVLIKYNDIFFDDGFRKSIIDILEKNYSNRFYHSLNHIVDCLKVLESVVEKSISSTPLPKKDQEILVGAILFHDIVYGENKDISDEKMSALLFEDFIEAYLNNQNYISSVKELILSTEHLRDSFVPCCVNQNIIDLMADIDLSILSENKEKYKKYSNGVRQEYAEVSDIDFAKGRTKVLINLSKKAEENKLYKTKYFKNRNKKALVNINNEINDLKQVINTLEKSFPKI